ncbi:TdeIII family type II restriction endonuclease [Elizabethkingia sp. HX XZB]|uniref:TdeIII family type II restriction endonuclease n=1 Tax=Elizabethkingia sp. HX XZB TaxID=3003193 RepID=UPI002A24C0F5|nr:TdeIII family type II restriction endonuclease [Elizabethkingia sp. HX XZB]MDX8568144.1 TdeIII family type II restriction endonuclease [Elizabethkingia sp. HX XZB]
MVSREEIFNVVKETVISSIAVYAKNKKKREHNFQILDLIIPEEREIRSVVGGMETSIGTTLWEPLAKAIAKLNGFEVLDQKLLSPSIMPSRLDGILQTLIEDRNHKQNTADQCHANIKEVCQIFLHKPINDFMPAPKGSGIDVWLYKDGVNYFFDTKTVQPNIADYRRYFEQLLKWYAFFYAKNPDQNAFARIVFPYNPYREKDFWLNTKNKGFPLEPYNEGWVQNDFWDFCSGLEDTYSIIYEAFVNIATSGELKDILKDVFYNDSSK